MSFFEAVKSVFTQYVGFSGRARRSEYWWYTLFLFIVGFILGLIIGITGNQNMNYLILVFELAVFLPTLSVSVRRLHDTGKSGWWVLLSLIPVIGSIILIIFYVMDSEPGSNQYGPNPKAEYAM